MYIYKYIVFYQAIHLRYPIRWWALRFWPPAPVYPRQCPAWLWPSAVSFGWEPWSKRRRRLVLDDDVLYIGYLFSPFSFFFGFCALFCAGHGSMGICNSIGSNTFDILLCLGVPWLIKAVFFPIQPGQNYVAINSAGLEYSAITLLSTLFLLYLTFSMNKFKLDTKVGIACLVIYLVFMVFASLIELNVFFRVNLPTCGRSWAAARAWS